MKKKLLYLFGFIFSFIFFLGFENQVDAVNKYALYTVENTYVDDTNTIEAYTLDLSGSTTISLKEVTMAYWYRNTSGNDVNAGHCNFTYDLSKNEIIVDSCTDHVIGNYENKLSISVNVDFSAFDSSSLTKICNILNKIDYVLIKQTYLDKYSEASNLVYQSDGLSVMLLTDVKAFGMTLPTNLKEMQTSTYTLIYDDTLLNEAYQEGFQAGKDSVDITVDNADAYQDGWTQGYQTGKESVDITSDNQQVHDAAYQQGYNDGQISVDITSNDEQIWNEAYQEGNDDGYTLGFEAGKDSIDLDQIKKEEYDRGYNNGYNVGFASGESSVDITSDNDKVIEAYITVNKYHTDYDFNLNFDRGYNAGITFVYKNIEHDVYIDNYIKDYIIINKYHTNTAFIDNYQSGYTKGYGDGYSYGYSKGLVEGKEVVYQNVASDPIIKEYWKTKFVNDTKINIINEGDEIIEVVKKYDVNYDSDDDITINIHQGQDNYEIQRVETYVPVEGNNNSNTVKEIFGDLDFAMITDVLLMIGFGLVALIIIVALASLATPKRKGRKYDILKY